LRGFVATPAAIVDMMIEKLFETRPPSPGSRVLDPGCGRGAFLEGIVRWCARNEVASPRIVGVESDPKHVEFLRTRFASHGNVEIREADFLQAAVEKFDYVIGNPPYVSLISLSEGEREEYRRRYETARGRFDLYLLFFEQALRSMDSNAKLVFITPEKYLYVETAAPLRKLLARHQIDQLHFLDEETFVGLVTYPLITTISKHKSTAATSIVDRSGTTRMVSPLTASTSWMPLIRDAEVLTNSILLEDVCIRISCGVATGSDASFLVEDSALTPGLRDFAFPTMAGRDISSTDLPTLGRSLLIPYDRNGQLLPEAQLGELGEYLSEPSRRTRLLARTCVVSKPWYSYHENPPLRDILRPKILCKDIGEEPYFVIDREGSIVPRHSTYYLVPTATEGIDELARYLNSELAATWLRNHCQRAAKGYLRLQSHVLKKLPLPSSFDWMAAQLDLAMVGSH
jgi:adenine-specific DNA-methyltransferase